MIDLASPLYHRDSLGNMNQVMDNMKINLTRYTHLTMDDDESYGEIKQQKPFPRC